MNMQSLIATRRDGKKHTEADLLALARAAADGTVPDYQLTAWLMAAYLKPLDAEETAWLTQAMAASGERLDLTGLSKPWVDKHSTGGVGDKTTIVLLPLLAACGLMVVKMSGRGLGITGGTVDKLSSIPGFRLDLSPEEMKQQAASIGLALTGQTPNLAPADKTLYALRDATATVDSVPLIVSSILSKKIAGGAETIVLDVKCGTGAFMRTTQEARVLARSLSETGKLCGLKTRIVVSDMNQPLGSAVGNALEVAEAVQILKGEPLPTSSERFRDLCLELAGITLEASGLVGSREEGVARAAEALRSGKALGKAREWFLAQGATSNITESLSALPVASIVREIRCSAAGWVSAIDAETVGRAVIALGGGRQTKADTVDLAVGVQLEVCVGSAVSAGQVLARVHANDEAKAEDAVRRVGGTIKVAPFEVPTPKTILATY